MTTPDAQHDQLGKLDEPGRAGTEATLAASVPANHATGFRPMPAPAWPWFRLSRPRLSGVPAWVARRVAVGVA